MSDKLSLPTSIQLLLQARRAIATREGLPKPVSDYRVAQELGITRGAVSAVRRGVTGWGQPTIIKLAEILEVNPQWLLMVMQAERAQNDRLRRLWIEAAQRLAMLLICIGVLVSVQTAYNAPGAIGQVYTLCALGGWVLSCLLGHLKRSRWALVGAALALSGCASLPAADYRADTEAQAAALTARFNALAGTAYPVPAIRWFDGPCEPGQMTGDASLRHDTVWISSDCARRFPAATREDLLPHELAHIFANRYYGADEDHDGLWQRVAVDLGLSRRNGYITDPSLRAGGG